MYDARVEAGGEAASATRSLACARDWYSGFGAPLQLERLDRLVGSMSMRAEPD